MNNVRVFIVLLVAVFVSSTASAQLIADTAQKAGAGRLEGGGVLSISEVAYEVHDSSGLGEDADIQRVILGGYGAVSVSERSDVYGALGIITKAEVDGSADSGSGFLLSGGVRIDLMDINVCDVLAYGQCTIISEDYGDGSDGSIFEIAGGVLARVAVDEKVNVYAGLDLYPVSSGDVEYMGFTSDFERDSLFGLRIGGNMDLGSLWLRGELAFVGETTVTLGAGTYF